MVSVEGSLFSLWEFPIGWCCVYVAHLLCRSDFPDVMDLILSPDDVQV